MKKTEKIPEYGHLMTTKEFKQRCEDGGFIDYDGYGYYATKDKMYRNELVKPSHIVGKKPKNFSHIVWFNC